MLKCESMKKIGIEVWIAVLVAVIVILSFQGMLPTPRPHPTGVSLAQRCSTDFHFAGQQPVESKMNGVTTYTFSGSCTVQSWRYFLSLQGSGSYEYLAKDKGDDHPITLFYPGKYQLWLRPHRDRSGNPTNKMDRDIPYVLIEIVPDENWDPGKNLSSRIGPGTRWARFSFSAHRYMLEAPSRLSLWRINEESLPLGLSGSWYCRFCPHRVHLAPDSPVRTYLKEGRE